MLRLHGCESEAKNQREPANSWKGIVYFYCYFGSVVTYSPLVCNSRPPRTRLTHFVGQILTARQDEFPSKFLKSHLGCGLVPDRRRSQGAPSDDVGGLLLSPWQRHNNTTKVPFEEFHKVLAFLGSIGLATVVSGAFTLATAQSVLGDTSATVLYAARNSAILLGWASACFILALVFIIATQLLYTDPTIRESLKDRDGHGVHKRIARVVITVFACLPLGLQVIAMFLLGESLRLLSGGPMMMARCGIVGGVCIALVTAVIIIGLDSEARNRYFGFLSKVRLTPH